jgi:hypothetical protein
MRELVIGFILTTVVGGALGYFFQTRSWRNQRESELREAERAAAIKVFEEVSMLLDRRQYRLAQMRYQLGKADTSSGLEPYLDAYREVVAAWNERLNRNLALTEGYFGMDVRDDLEFRIYEGFKELGELMERIYRQDVADRTNAVALLERGGDLMNRFIYDLNAEMIDLIKNGAVGRDAPAASHGDDYIGWHEGWRDDSVAGRLRRKLGFTVTSKSRSAARALVSSAPPGL